MLIKKKNFQCADAQAAPSWETFSDTQEVMRLTVAAADMRFV